MFVYLWPIMVCSRYPKECRYYETVLKRKCLRKLKDNVWERKTKWILLEKAECHYRAKVLLKHFNSWIAYLNECYKKKINRRAAECFHEEKLKSKGLSALKRNAEDTRVLMRVYGKKFEWGLKQRCWHQWKHYTQKRVKVREIKLLADRIREERLRIRCFYLWSFRLREKLLLQEAYRRAETKHSGKLLEKYFKLWRMFREKRAWKVKIGKLAVKCYEDKLKEKLIGCWRRYTFQKKRYRYQMKVIREFYESYLVKNYLNRWAIAYGEVKLNRKMRNHILAVDFHNRRLLVRSFRVLCEMRRRRREREEKEGKFREIYATAHLSFYLNLWLEKRRQKLVCDCLEKKGKLWREDYLRELLLTKLSKRYEERLEEKEEMANVKKYSDAVIIHRAFRGWAEVTERKVRRRQESENAVRFYSERISRRAFDNWKEFRAMRCRKKMSGEYYRMVLLSRAMEEWKAFVSVQRKKLSEARELEKRLRTRLMRNAFECWKDEVKSVNCKLIVAAGFDEKSKLSRAFRVWKKNARIKAAHKIRYNRNKAILNDVVIKGVILRWYEMLSTKLSLERKLFGFRSRRDKRSMRFYFGSWHRFAEKMKSVELNARAYPQIKSTLLVEEYLILMSEAVRRKKNLRRKTELARRAEEKMLKRKYLRKWLCFICWRRERILRSMTEERRCESRKGFELAVPIGMSVRRQPVIPDFLRSEMKVDLFEGCLNQETFRVTEPVNRRLPVIGQRDSFVFSDV